MVKKNIGIITHVRGAVGDVSFEKGLMTVEYDETKTTDQTILKTLQDKTTYSCSLKKDEPKKGFFKRIFSWV